jgi:hypothetical protein
MGVTVLTESRQQTCKSSGSSGRLGGRIVGTVVMHVELRGTRMEYATHEGFGGLGLKTIGRTVSEVGPQISGGGSEEERIAPGGIEEFASKRSYLMKGAVAVG